MDTFTGENAEVTPKGNDTDLRQYTRILTVGISVLIDLHPKTPATSRHRATLLGWDEGRVLLFEPNAGEDSTCFREGDRCQVRFVQDGQIWGFYSHLKSNVQDSVSFMIEVEWPESVSKVRLRRHERVDIALPCRLFLEDGSQISARLQDLSAGGCRLQTALHLNTGNVLKISFDMPDAAKVDCIPIEVQNRKELEGGESEFGCSFLDMEESALCGIGAYVARVIAKRRGQEHRHPCVLLLTNEAGDAIPLRNALKEFPMCDVMVSTGFFDAGYRLMHYAPLALLIHGAFQDPSAREIDAMLHEVPSLKAMPVIVYNAPATEVETHGKTVFTDDLHQAAEYLRAILTQRQAVDDQ